MTYYLNQETLVNVVQVVLRMFDLVEFWRLLKIVLEDSSHPLDLEKKNFISIFGDLFRLNER